MVHLLWIQMENSKLSFPYNLKPQLLNKDFYFIFNFLEMGEERLVKIIVIGPSMSGKTSKWKKTFNFTSRKMGVLNSVCTGSIQRFCRQGAITQGYRATVCLFLHFL